MRVLRSSSLSELARAISEAIRTKRAFFLPVVDHTPRNPERSRRCQDELDTRVEPCARLVGSINRVVRYISHPAVRSARIPTLYLRGVAPPRLARGGREVRSTPLQSRPISDLHASGSCSYPTGPDSTFHRPAKDTATHLSRVVSSGLLISVVDRRVRSPRITDTTVGAKRVNGRFRFEIRIADRGCRMIDQFFRSVLLIGKSSYLQCSTCYM